MKREIVFALIVLMLLPFILAVDCPHGEINDAYPGVCGSYIDQNKDGICDESQTIQESSQLKLTQQPQIESGLIGTPYNFLIIAIISIIIYLSSSFLSRAGKIYSPLIHKRIWNLLLLISFLGVAISGLLFVLRAEFGINLSWFPKMLFWHVETGIVMAIIALFHILWHLSYFKLYFKR